jgi:colanic acid biosynthesis glycosyl transferase WcaI
MESNISIRPLSADDAKECTQVHLEAFPGFFLTILGPCFLTQLYASIPEDKSGIGFVAIDQDRVIGFATGTSEPEGFYARLIKKKVLKFAWVSIGPVIKKPRIFPRLLRAFSLRKQELPTPFCGTLMSIAVLPETQGRGVGQMLVAAFLEDAKRRHLRYVNLTTDRDNNESTNQFYQRLGFQLHRSYVTPEGRHMNEYVIAL